jgi:hypothetical protein
MRILGFALAWWSFAERNSEKPKGAAFWFGIHAEQVLC